MEHWSKEKGKRVHKMTVNTRQSVYVSSHQEIPQVKPSVCTEEDQRNDRVIGAQVVAHRPQLVRTHFNGEDDALLQAASCLAVIR